MTGKVCRKKVCSNQITFIGLVSSKNYYRRPRIITVIVLEWDTTGWNKFRREYMGTG